MFKNSIEDTEDHAIYCTTHHTAGDSMSILDADDMDTNTVGIAAFLFIIADLEHSVRDVKKDLSVKSWFWTLNNIY